MRVLLSTYGTRGDTEPLAALAVRLQALGAEVRVCAPLDCAERLAEVGVPLVPVGPPMRQVADDAAPPSAADVPRRTAELIAAQFDTLAGAARGCDVLVATGLMPAAAGALSVAEMLGIRSVYVSYCPIFLPSPHHPPHPLPGRPFPPDVTDNGRLHDLNIKGYNALFGEAINTRRASVGLTPVDNVRDYVLTDRPWLATDPILGPWQPTDLDVVQTGAWLLPDERPLPAELLAFLESGAPPVYVGFGSMAMRASKDAARAAMQAVRAQGHRMLISRGWARLAPIDDRDDCLAIGEVNHQALFRRVAAVVHHGGAGTTTTAALAGAPQVVVPLVVDQPYWAGRVADLGIGAAHDGPAPTAESLSVALRTALTPQTRARATAMAGAIRADGATEAATRLVDLISQPA